MKINNLQLFFALLLLFVFSSCGYEGDKEKKAVENNSETAVSTTGNSEVYMSAESWHNWSPPKQLSGYALVSFVTDPFKLNGLYSAGARYENGDVFIAVQVVDGSTEKGKAEIRDHLAIAELQRDHSSKYGYEKTLERNGIKAKEEYLAPPAGQYLIKYMHKARYGVSIKSNAKTAEEIWSFAEKLGLEPIGE